MAAGSLYCNGPRKTINNNDPRENVNQVLVCMTANRIQLQYGIVYVWLLEPRVESRME